MVLATTPEGKFVINREYRYPTKEILLSCPGGLIDEGEEIISCAKRELLEETGYVADKFKSLGSSYPFPGITGQKTIFIRAFGAKKLGRQHLDSCERIETLLFTKETLFQEIQKGTPVDGILLSALFLSALNKES